MREEQGASQTIDQAVRQLLAKQEECEKAGHPNATSLGRCYGTKGLYWYRMFCPDCTTFYHRPATDEEGKKWRELMKSRIEI